ncbi:unnamed protein product [Clonostachys chloroleuca]|uniref:Uncharacterized protein n=1 Tax=Clonostachys chloroleuca TaxID=1926264 RepID=A0AA35M7R5_9HYPO|nr:unnamed protein product [Clonostachys chloroleuca]
MLGFGGVFVLVGLIFLAAAFGGAIFAVKFAFFKLPSDAGVHENSRLQPRLTVCGTALWVAVWSLLSIVSIYVSEPGSSNEVLTSLLVHGTSVQAFVSAAAMFLNLNFQIGMVSIFGDTPTSHYERESIIKKSSRLLTCFLALVVPLAIAQSILIEISFSSSPHVPGSGLYNALAGVQLAIGLIFLITATISLILMKNWTYYFPLLLVGGLSLIRHLNTVAHDIALLVGYYTSKFGSPTRIVLVWYDVSVFSSSWTTVIGLIILLQLLATYFSDAAAESSPVDDRRPLLDRSWESSAGTFTG